MLDRLATLRDKRDRDGGFTLIELLVVVVIIGILIAIAIPLYLNYKKGANDKAAMSDLRAAISSLEQCNTDNGKYPDTVPPGGGNPTGTCTTAKIVTSSGTNLTYVASSDKSNYDLWAKNNNGSGKTYCYATEAGGSVVSSPPITSTPTYGPACTVAP